MTGREQILVQRTDFIRVRYGLITSPVAEAYDIRDVNDIDIAEIRSDPPAQVCIQVEESKLLLSDVVFKTVTSHNQAVALRYFNNPADSWSDEFLERLTVARAISDLGISAHISHPNSHLSRVISGKAGIHFVPMIRPGKIDP